MYLMLLITALSNSGGELFFDGGTLVHKVYVKAFVYMKL